MAFAHRVRGKHDSDSNHPDFGSDDDDEMTANEKLERSRWIATGGQDRRLSIWEVISFEKT